MKPCNFYGKRVEINQRDLGLSLAQAILLAEYGDVIVVHRESDKRLGEGLARQRRPGVRIDFVVEPVQG
jgi:hypothetical protein